MATFSELITNVVVKGSISTTSAFYTDALIEREVSNAYRWASAFHKWPMTEYMDKSGVFAAGTEENSYPNAGFRTDSIRILKVGDDRFRKIRFEDYLIFREDENSNTEKVFSDYGRTIYINPNCVSGTIYAYGQLGVSDFASSSSTSVFSAGEPEGDEAIVEKTISNLKPKAGKLQESADWENKARVKLEELWKRIQAEQYAYSPKNKGMFERLDCVEGEWYKDKNNPLQWS